MTNLFNLFSNEPIRALGLEAGIYNPEVLSDERSVANSNYNYVINSDGLRSVELSSKPPIIALGCSMTFGSGLPEDQTWHQIISKKIGMPVANMGYIGGSIMKVISSFFGAMKKYDYKPDIVLGLFPSIERFYFVNGWGTEMADYYSHIYTNKKTKAVAPFKYDEFLPHEWVYYINFEYIKMLEEYCKASKIKLIWTNWTQHNKESLDNFLSTTFDNFIVDQTSTIFPKVLEDVGPKESTDEAEESYKCYLDCHKEQSNSEIFNIAYDIGKRRVTRADGKDFYGIEPHPGIHRHHHWAELFLSHLDNL